MVRDLKSVEWNSTATGKGIFSSALYIFSGDPWITLDLRIYFLLQTIQPVYYPILAVVAVSVNVLTIVVLSRGKCGLSKGVTRYLMAMAAADLLVVNLDLILRQIPIVYREAFIFLRSIPVCNLHAVLLYAVTDCSVWFTVTFTFDRCVNICCQKMKVKHRTEKTAAVTLATVTMLSCLKNIFWYFMFSGNYQFLNSPWFCYERYGVLNSKVWTSVEFFHYLLTPVLPFILILVLNALTIRHVLVVSRVRRRLRDHSSGESPKDPEMESRRKSLILLLFVSGNFIILWALFTMVSVWSRLWSFALSILSFSFFMKVYPPVTLRELGFMLQLLSCCTNTALYAVTQTKFRQQLKEVVKYPLTLVVRCTQNREGQRRLQRSRP